MGRIMSAYLVTISPCPLLDHSITNWIIEFNSVQFISCWWVSTCWKIIIIIITYFLSLFSKWFPCLNISFFVTVFILLHDAQATDVILVMFKALTGVVFPWRKYVIGAWHSFVDVPQHEGEEAPELYWLNSLSSP